MITIKKTPGVYIEEISNIPPSVASVDTAVPAFLGYTDKEDLKFTAKKIYSKLDFEEKFCDFSSWKLSFDVKSGEVDEDFSRNELYYHMQLYFANGGGKCYVISLGTKPKNSKGKKDDYLKALDTLLKEDEPTLIVMPEAAQLPFESCIQKCATASK